MFSIAKLFPAFPRRGQIGAASNKPIRGGCAFQPPLRCSLNASHRCPRLGKAGNNYWLANICLVSGLLSIILISCRKEAPIPLTPQFHSIQANLLNRHCAIPGCHVGNAPESQLNLEPGNAYGNLVNVPSSGISELLRVKPGNAAESYLISKLTGSGIVGERMPMGKPPLPDSLVQIVRQWINHGAVNN